MKTDNAAEVGKHAFELAGLGLAPFRFIGVEEKFRTNPDDSTSATGTCDFCGTGIRYAFGIRSADGKCSVVGCDCIAKVGDAGLMKAYKSSPEWRKLQQAKRDAKAVKVLAELSAFLASVKEQYQQLPHPRGLRRFDTSAPLTRWDYVTGIFNKCGAAGRSRWLSTFKQEHTSLPAATPEFLAELAAVAAAQADVEDDGQRAEGQVHLNRYADALADGRGGFRDSIAADMRRGLRPSGRALSIVLDILNRAGINTENL